MCWHPRKWRCDVARYSVGIDLGTTHCVVAYQDLTAPDAERTVQVLPIPQLVAPGNLAERSLLPSFIYTSHPQEFNPEDIRVPWPVGERHVVGELARQLGSKTPARLVSSAKSWLSHGVQDAREAFLPLDAPEDVARLSPLQATSHYLDYLRQAWNAKFPDEPLEQQTITITVPASFDPAARDMTVEAARSQGFEELTLLEEPQAAFYAWLAGQGTQWRDQLQVGDILLVVDIGGGTSDFSMIAVTEENGELSLQRVAVGQHILLGGDNMDLALAYALRQKLLQQGRQLDQWQVLALAHGCREAKEQMLSDPSISSMPLVVPSRGSSLIGGSIRTELEREELERVLLEGFFPLVEADAQPQQRMRTALTTRSLPYAQDAAISRHLAAFLSSQKENAGGPTKLLINGGVFKAHVLVERLRANLDHWLSAEGRSIEVLQGADLDLAVARGAAVFGAVRKGGGLRVKAGLANSYYVGVESSMPAVPGFEPPLMALCVAPFGMEEGESLRIEQQSFGVVVGQPAQFRFFASATRRDEVGSLFEIWGNELEELEPIEVNLSDSEAGEGGKVEQVQLEARVTETGTLRLAAVSERSGKRWDVEFSVRQR